MIQHIFTVYKLYSKNCNEKCYVRPIVVIGKWSDYMSCQEKNIYFNVE